MGRYQSEKDARMNWCIIFKARKCTDLYWEVFNLVTVRSGDNLEHNVPAPALEIGQ
jgi:hypothetical protein